MSLALFSRTVFFTARNLKQSNAIYLEEMKETMELTVGTVLEGKIKTITNFGAFVALPEN